MTDKTVTYRGNDISFSNEINNESIIRLILLVNTIVDKSTEDMKANANKEEKP